MSHTHTSAVESKEARDSIHGLVELVRSLGDTVGERYDEQTGAMARKREAEGKLLRTILSELLEGSSLLAICGGMGHVELVVRPEEISVPRLALVIDYDGILYLRGTKLDSISDELAVETFPFIIILQGLIEKLRRQLPRGETADKLRRHAAMMEAAIVLIRKGSPA